LVDWSIDWLDDRYVRVLHLLILYQTWYTTL